jgi:hypothetical protein
MGKFQIPVGRIWTVAIPFWSECLSQFHSLEVTTLQTKVSLVSIGHRGSPSLPSDWVGWTLSAGFTPLEMPFPDACRLPLASLSKYCSQKQLHERLQAHPTALPRTWHAPFDAPCSPETNVFSTHLRHWSCSPSRPTSAFEGGLLWRFAAWLALPTSDYYRHSVTVPLSRFRPSPSYRSPSLRT